MKSNIKNSSIKIVLILSVVFFVLCSGVFLFIYKQVNENKGMSEKIGAEWQAESDRREEMKSLERTLKAVEQEKALLESHFAQSSNIVPFLDTIESLAFVSKTKGEVSSVDLLKDNAGLVVGIKATGTFDSIYKFLLLLENSPYAIEFLSMNMEREAPPDPSVQGPKVATWSVAFKARLLSFVP